MYSLLRLRVLSLALAASTAIVSAKTVTVPGISVQPPASLNVTAGAKVVLSVTANGTAPLSYQWQFNDGNISGATKSTYTISKVVAANAGFYRVIVNNASKEPVTSNTTTLSVSPNYAGKYNLAIIGYNATLVDASGGTFISDGNASGGAHFGTATVTTVAGMTSLAGSPKEYLGAQPNTSIMVSGNVSSSGVVTFDDPGSDLTTNMIQYNGTTIGFIGTGTAGGVANTTFILGLNATTTAPTSIAACVGNYTLLAIDYNATAVSKGNATLNDGKAQIAAVTVSANGTVSISSTLYATGGGNTLGPLQPGTGTVSSSGVLTITGKTGTSIKFVTLNGQVIGIEGTAKPVTGHPNSSILLGIRGTFTPL
jgi:hypothetical protein